MIYSTLIGIYPSLHMTCVTVITKLLGIGGAAARKFLMKFVEERINTRRVERGKGLKMPEYRNEDDP